ncbi:hypothetical protein CCM_01561 [Cordyceps militaris CM01]|uniref:Uncharacterized protein n=2 Tax=Cordyceps militaris TaxID=73501 RepID=G3J5P7_CORMM|nr:uncharacterized protein CCM_01561 [Cordyceps militaris CM01]ATY65233.1 hypothetical protein A9K55_004769 [Cordyceps militaris]EGX96903.1 hypothetical protein CCM_01561 [Cordyceps militaris CM01]
MSAEQSQLAALTAQIVQMHQEMEYWTRQLQHAQTQLQAAQFRSGQYTRHGQNPDPFIVVAVNNHSVACNQIQQNMAVLLNRKAAAEVEHARLSRLVTRRGF